MFPFNWFPLREGSKNRFVSPISSSSSFHSIGFPCERGASAKGLSSQSRVSIQLVSPARGEGLLTLDCLAGLEVFPFNWFPLREGRFFI